MATNRSALRGDKPQKALKLTRSERAVILRERILVAAAKVVGEFGYQNAAVGRIALEADVAQGTIYLYFETRQHLFDELLPHAGKRMMDFVGERIQGSRNFIEVEERGVRAFFDYLRENPGHYRILNEAEFSAPIGHRKHFEDLIDRYLASMKRSMDEGTLPVLSDAKCRVAAYQMMATRSYLYLAYVKYGGFETPPQDVIDAYVENVAACLRDPA